MSGLSTLTLWNAYQEVIDQEFNAATLPNEYQHPRWWEKRHRQLNRFAAEITRRLLEAAERE